MTNEEILNISFYCNDLGKEITIKQYLKALLEQLFLAGEGFSGKRPFGNSGWEYDIQNVLVKNKILTGKSESKYYKKVFELIEAM